MNWWQKWRDDFSSTRIQLTYLVVGLFAFAVIKTILKVSNVSDGVQVINALAIPFSAVLTYHMAGKWMDAKTQNGNGEAPSHEPQ